MAWKIFWVHGNSSHRNERKETDIKSHLAEWYIKPLGSKQYLELTQTTWFCKFLSKLKSRFLWVLKGNSFLNYWVIFSTPVELYNQTWSKHCTRSTIEHEFKEATTLWTCSYKKRAEMKTAYTRSRTWLILFETRILCLYCIQGACKWLKLKIHVKLCNFTILDNFNPWWYGLHMLIYCTPSDNYNIIRPWKLDLYI